MSLFNRKTRLDQAHLFNGVSFDLGPVNVSSDGVSVSNPFKPENYHIGTSSINDTIDQVKDNINTAYEETIDASTTWLTGGLINDASELSDIVSTYAGNLSGGTIGTSSQERMDAEQKTAQLNVSYEGYGQYRGELEKARQQNTSIKASVRGSTMAKLAASGILKGSAEWNRRLAQVEETYSAEASRLDQKWNDYIDSTEYATLTENYNLDWRTSYNFEGLDVAEVEKLKPTFDEFYTLTRGADEEKASMIAVFDMRKENLVNTRTS